jgi:hypothetical protein
VSPSAPGTLPRTVSIMSMSSMAVPSDCPLESVSVDCMSAWVAASKVVRVESGSASYAESGSTGSIMMSL